MMKIAIYGTGRYAQNMYKIIERIARVTGGVIVAFIETVPSKDTFKDRPVVAAKDFDYASIDKLVIAIDSDGEIKKYLSDNIADYDALKGKIVTSYDLQRFITEFMPVQSVEVDGLQFVNEKTDDCILRHMRFTNQTFAVEEIKLFLKLTSQYYGKDNKGIFLDVGANIGTTSIYIKKSCPNMEVIGFECSKINYDMFRINTILNQMEDITIENIALNNKIGKQNFLYNLSNPGASRLLESNDARRNDENCSEVEVTTLDSYMNRNKIDADRIGYIWMDTEGAEAEIIDGAFNLLHKKKIPLWQEFNPQDYIEKNLFEKYIENMKVYSGFIDGQEALQNNIIERKIDELKDYPQIMKEGGRVQTDLFFY